MYKYIPIVNDGYQTNLLQGSGKIALTASPCAPQMRETMLQRQYGTPLLRIKYRKC